MGGDSNSTTGSGNVMELIEERRKQLEEKKNADKQQRELNHEQNADDLVQAFWKKFSLKEEILRKRVEDFIEQKKQPIYDTSKEIKLDDIIVQVGEMREEAASAASLYLSPYDIRQTQLIVSKLLDHIENTRTAFAPRKKFSFRSKTKKSSNEMEEAPKASNEKKLSKEQSENIQKKLTNSESNNQNLINLDELVYANKQNEFILIDEKTFFKDPTKRRDLNFSQLTNCTIVICVETSAIRGDQLKSCRIYSGPIWGSLWLETCDSCEFYVACRQLRVHLSVNTTFYLRIPSHPIIEDCTKMKFGSYQITYPGLDTQLERVGLLKDSGMWAKVNDFKWHKAQQSPNWSLVDPKKPLSPLPNSVINLVQFKSPSSSSYIVE
jgi:hypothetical protein